MFNIQKILLTTIASSLCLACSAGNPTPDKTLGGSVVGAGWGSGAGAVIGNQIGNVGAGTAVGAGFGLAAGAISGNALDQVDNELANQRAELDILEVQTQNNLEGIQQLHSKLDDRERGFVGGTGGLYQVFFDADVTSLRGGALQNLEAIAESIKKNPHVRKIKLVGHTDDSGAPKYNERLSETRARNVAAYLMSRGISSSRIKIESQGGKMPLASNATEVGRQLNRRVDLYLLN